MNMRRSLPILAVTAFLPVAAFGQSDSKFVKEASEGSLAEVELGQLAQQKGQSQAVKDFGNRMVIDHTKANSQLKAIADQKGNSVSTSLGVSNKALKLKLEALSGDSFDRAYMSSMVKDHQEDIAAFQKEADTGADPDVKSFAAKTLPTLKEHLSMAQKAAAAVGVK